MKQMVTNILFATDLSENSGHAMRNAASIAMATGAGRHGEIFKIIEHLDHIFIRQYLAGIFDGFVNRQRPQAFGMGGGVLVVESVEIVFVDMGRHVPAGFIICTRPKSTAKKYKIGIIQAVPDRITGLPPK